MIQPTAEQLAALRAYADKHGAQWKRKLKTAWINGSDVSETNGGYLRQIRNQFGPIWLASFKA